MTSNVTREAKSSTALVPCSHCGLPTPVTPKSDRAFCCNGCMGAYAMIHELGLEDYYKLRTTGQGSQYVRDSESRIESLVDLEAAGVQVNHLPGGMDCVRLSVDGMHCAACSWLIERVQPTIRGLHSARVRLSDHSVELIYDPEQTNVARVASRLSKIGYELSPWQDDPDYNAEITIRQREHWAGIALAAFLAANAMWIGVALYAGESTGISAGNEYFLRWIGAILGLLSALLPGRIFLQTAWQAILSKSPHVDIPVAVSLCIGTAGSLVGAWYGSGHIYFDSLASLVLLLRIGRYLQFRAQSVSRNSISKLLRWNSQVAHLLDESGNRHAIPASRLVPNDLVLVEPGGIIPADGIVEDGESSVDSSLLTGETLPVLIQSGSRVVGGTTNLNSAIRVRVEAAGESSRVGKLMAMVREATTYRTPWIQAADRVGRWFVVVVLLLAVGTWVGWSVAADTTVATQHTMALLTIACPCALALAAPLVITIALGRAAKRQIWIREGDCLEKLAKPGMLWLDKTGTLTLGRMHVHEWVGDEKWLPAIAAIECCVHHPIASAIVRFSEANDWSGNTSEGQAVAHSNDWDPTLDVAAVVQERGFGVRAIVNGKHMAIGNADWMKMQLVSIRDQEYNRAKQIADRGQTTIWVAADGEVVGMFAVGDALRPDAAGSLQEIQSMGWRMGILSGDHPQVVEKIANSLREQGIHIDQVLGGQSPEDKLRVIRQSLSSDGRQTVMVGDGVNDAGALAAADVGIAVRGNSEQSLAIAPVYIANPRLSSLVDLMRASREVVVGIRRCFIASLLYNAITISLAIAGLIHPLIAALFMPLSGLTVLTMALNSRTFVSKRKKGTTIP